MTSNVNKSMGGILAAMNKTVEQLSEISERRINEINKITFDYRKEFEEYKEKIDAILKELVFREKALEINTRRFHEKSAVENMKNIYKRFYELGGKLVVLGSDAHTEETIGKNLKLAKEIAQDCNLNVVYFKNRKPQYDR